MIAFPPTMSAKEWYGKQGREVPMMECPGCLGDGELPCEYCSVDGEPGEGCERCDGRGWMRCDECYGEAEVQDLSEYRAQLANDLEDYERWTGR